MSYKDVKIGQYCVIGNNVDIGAGTVIGHHVVIHDGTVIGENVRIDDFACLGKQPMKAANSAVTSNEQQVPCQIGDTCIIGTSAIIYAGCTLGSKVLVADLAVVRERVTVGSRTIIGKGATIECDCRVGNRCKIQTNVYITAYSVVEDDCFIAPCVMTSNDNYAGRSEARKGKFAGLTLKKGGRIGVGAVILPGKTIAEDALVAAGSVVTTDVKPKTIVYGTPAKYLRNVPDDQLLENQK